MIKINKPAAYLIGLLLSFLIYLVVQLIFFINTEKAMATICDIRSKRGGRSPGRTEIFYACFTTERGEEIKFRAGSNLKLDYDSTVGVVYKINNPHIARLDIFSTLWVIPSFIYFFIPFIFIMAVITGAYYGSRYLVLSFKPFRMRLSNK